MQNLLYKIIKRFYLYFLHLKSRNEILASTFRRYNICEERGSIFKKAVNLDYIQKFRRIYKNDCKA